MAPSGESFRNTFFFLRMVQSFYRRYLQNTTNNVTGAQEDHDRSRYAAYSVKRKTLDLRNFKGNRPSIRDTQGLNVTLNDTYLTGHLDEKCRSLGVHAFTLERLCAQ